RPVRTITVVEAQRGGSRAIRPIRSSTPGLAVIRGVITVTLRIGTRVLIGGASGLTSGRLAALRGSALGIRPLRGHVLTGILRRILVRVHTRFVRPTRAGGRVG